jgi:hypothetical protein
MLPYSFYGDWLAVGENHLEGPAWFLDIIGVCIVLAVLIRLGSIWYGSRAMLCYGYTPFVSFPHKTPRSSSLEFFFLVPTF